MTCNGLDSYHCLLTEGGVSLREQCTEASLFTDGINYNFIVKILIADLRQLITVFFVIQYTKCIMILPYYYDCIS